MYDDVKIPEPNTLFDHWWDNEKPARYQELEIDRHMHLNFDLFVDLVPEFDGDAVEGQYDRTGWENMQRMSSEQMKVWRDAYGPKDKDFHDQKLEGDALVRWKFQRYIKNYLRCIKGVDESVGTIMDTLKDLDLDDNTIVIYSSDQGFFLGDHGWFDKRWMYEESLQMPLIIKWPGVTKPDSKCDLMVQNLDYAETFLDMAKTEIPDDMQGHSLVPLLKGESPPDWRKSIYYHYYEYPSVHMVPRHYGARTEQYKLMKFYQFGDEWEFYDLKNDPDELTNQYKNPAYANKIAEVRKEMDRLRKQYDDDSDVSEKPKAWQKEMRTPSL